MEQRVTVHQANRKQLHVGDLVIHDRDAKEHRMVRVVVAILPGDLVRTVFQFRHELPEACRKRVRHDRSAQLLDPKRFGISISKRKVAA